MTDAKDRLNCRYWKNLTENCCFEKGTGPAEWKSIMTVAMKLNVCFMSAL